MPTFTLGRCIVTPGALAALQATGEAAATYLARHASGDWGDLPDQDVQTNVDAVLHGGRLMSAYHLGDGTAIWVITEIAVPSPRW